MAYMPLGGPLEDLLKTNLKPTLSTVKTTNGFAHVVSTVANNAAVKNLAKAAAEAAKQSAQNAAKLAKQNAENAKKANEQALKLAKQKADQDRKLMEARAKADRKAAEDRAKAEKKARDTAAKIAKDKAKAEQKAAKDAADELKRTDFDLDPIGPVASVQSGGLAPDTTAADASADTLRQRRQRPVYTTPQGGEVYEAGPDGPMAPTTAVLPELTSTAPAPAPAAASFGLIGAAVLIGILLTRKGSR